LAGDSPELVAAVTDAGALGTIAGIFGSAVEIVRAMASEAQAALNGAR
jgi:hypothetical protein